MVSHPRSACIISAVLLWPISEQHCSSDGECISLVLSSTLVPFRTFVLTPRYFDQLKKHIYIECILEQVLAKYIIMYEMTCRLLTSTMLYQQLLASLFLNIVLIIIITTFSSGPSGVTFVWCRMQPWHDPCGGRRLQRARVPFARREGGPAGPSTRGCVDNTRLTRQVV